MKTCPRCNGTNTVAMHFNRVCCHDCRMIYNLYSPSPTESLTMSTPMFATTSTLAAMGCPSEHCAEMQAANVPTATMQALTGAGISWLKIIPFIVKWKALGVEIITVIVSGGTLWPILLANIGRVPELFEDLKELFAGGADAAPDGSPIIA